MLRDMWATSAALAVAPKDRRELERIVRSGKTEQRVALRARIVLGAAAGKSNAALAKELKTSRPTVIDWRARFAGGGMAALYDDRPRGRSFRPLVRAKQAEVIARTQTAPPQATQWSCRRMAEICGISKASVQRIWQANGLKPHLVKTFKLSNDPDFIEKLEDVVGLYMNPPDRALVFCIDEKSQIQALDRTQPGLPIKKGRAGTMTHDYKRHGTTTLFAALNVLDGTIIGRNMQRHRHQEFIRFLNTVEAEVPAGKVVHVILDNYAAHKHPMVRRWLDRHPRWTFHFTPTSCSWLNAVEGFFAKLTKRRLKRGTFRSITDLQASINRFLAEYNVEPKPFRWTADPDKIIAAVRRGHQVLESIH
jgi:transposase